VVTPVPKAGRSAIRAASADSVPNASGGAGAQVDITALEAIALSSCAPRHGRGTATTGVHGGTSACMGGLQRAQSLRAAEDAAAYTWVGTNSRLAELQDATTPLRSGLRVANAWSSPLGYSSDVVGWLGTWGPGSGNFWEAT
jgi:hypothetical protein